MAKPTVNSDGMSSKGFGLSKARQTLDRHR